MKINTTNVKISIEKRNAIVSAAVCNNPETVVSAIREMGINNPVETENAWAAFYSADENGKPVFHTQNLKQWLFDHGFMTVAQLNNEKCTCKEIAWAVFNALKAGVFPIKATKQTGIKGYSPIRLSRDFSGKMRGKWAFSTLSLINSFCIARMKNPELVCFYCYVEKALKQNIIGMLNYVQNFFFMTAANLPDILIPVLNPVCVGLRDGIRIESFGDIQDMNQQRFYARLAYKNPVYHFTQWSKNPAIVCRVFAEMGKPENMKFGLSMSRINKMDHDAYKWILTGFVDFMFVVCDNDEDRDHLLDMPFSRPCMCEEYSCARLCRACYLPETTIQKSGNMPAVAVERLRK